MRALTRMRLLAAVCALLMTFGSIARAGAPGRPIDQPGSPPEPVPLQVGDPDQPGGSITITFTLFGRVYLVHFPWSRAAILPASKPSIPLVTRRGRHAR